ncbi:dihydrodipicolinate synthase family protein [Oxyplasma meridianum]|uniref:Dihydrodipicolinate synthase family protein n=1 Tax=Oxyplasma meridianum TaxID=3073602 RepID=A0AAX4NEF8_9ARCH
MNSGKIIIPAITPFRNQQIDGEAVEVMVEYAMKNRFDGLFAGSSTGGVAALSYKKHKEVLKTYIDKITGNVTPLAGISRNDLDETTSLGKDAVDYGYRIIVLINPYYHSYSDKTFLIYFSNVLESVDADFYLYNNPGLTGRNLKPEVVATLHDKYPNVKGVKESSGDLGTFSKFLAIKGLEVFQGKDTLLYESMKMGSAGGICSSANFSLNTLKIAKDLPDSKESAEKVKKLMEVVSDYENPVIHNYLFRKYIANESPSGYMRKPYSDLDSVPPEDIKNLL